MKTTLDKEPVAITEGVRIMPLERGALRQSLMVERTYGSSTFRQVIRLYEGAQADRIDLVTDVDWSTTGALLKAEFPLSVSNPQATYDLGMGNSFPAELIPRELDLGGIHYSFPAPDTLNAVKCRGQKIDLPAGTERVHLLLASITRDQMVDFTVGTQNISVLAPYYAGFIEQWGHTDHTEGYLKPAEMAYVATHRHSQSENVDLPYEFAYMYDVAIDIPAGATNITLPMNDRIAVFAATAVQNDNRRLQPVTPILVSNSLLLTLIRRL